MSRRFGGMIGNFATADERQAEGCEERAICGPKLRGSSCGWPDHRRSQGGGESVTRLILLPWLGQGSLEAARNIH